MRCCQRGNLLQLPYTPLRISRLERLVKGFIAGRGGDTLSNEGAVQQQRPAGWQQPPRARHEPQAAAPGRNVDHVDVDDGRHVLGKVVGYGWPRGGGGVQVDGRQQGVSRAFRHPRRDAVTRLGARVAGEPPPGRQVRRPVRGVLPRATGHLQHTTAGRQHSPQHVQDGVAVPVGRRGVLPQVGAARHRARYDRASSGKLGRGTKLSEGWPGPGAWEAECADAHSKRGNCSDAAFGQLLDVLCVRTSQGGELPLALKQLAGTFQHNSAAAKCNLARQHDRSNAVKYVPLT